MTERNHRIHVITIVEAPIFMAASPNSASSNKENRRNDIPNDINSNSSSNYSLNVQTETCSILNHEIHKEQNLKTSSNSLCPSSTSPTPSKRMSWPIKLIDFFRKISKKRKQSLSIDQTSTTDSRKGSKCQSILYHESDSSSRPSVPSIKIDDETIIHTSNTLNQISTPTSNLVADHDLDMIRQRKHSAGACEMRIFSKPRFIYRKLTPDPMSLTASLPTNETNEIDSRLTEYVMNVKTSDRFGAGTDANVFLQLFGEHGTSRVYSLTHSNNVNKFERNQLDKFIFHQAVSLGKLHMVKIWHDNTGVGAPWHLEYVEVSDTSLGQLFRFPCHAWLSENDTLCRELKCFEVLEGQKKAIQIALGVPRQDRSNSLSNLSIKSARSESLPVTPTVTRKVPNSIPKLTPLPPILTPIIFERPVCRVVPAESVFTPAPTRPPPVIRFPVPDNENENESDNRFGVRQHANTVPVFSSVTLMAAARKNANWRSENTLISEYFKKERKRSIYGPLAEIPSGNGHNVKSATISMVRYASTDSVSSDEGNLQIDLVKPCASI